MKDSQENALNESQEKTRQWKASRYNRFFPGNDGAMLAYNSFSNSFARIAPEKYPIIQRILSGPGEFNPQTDEEKKMKGDLIQGGFLIDESLDEYQILKVQNLIGRFANRTLSITIAPTLCCNFNCTYCFENQKKENITESVEAAILAFADKKLAELKNLHISWFGGEPLLKIDTIERMMISFSHLVKKHNGTIYPSSIITNGYLLNREYAERLKKVNIHTAQITIDGHQAVHDQRRRLKNGAGTFETIIENIKEASKVLRITVRINVDKDNADSLGELFDLWSELGLEKRVPFYFGKVVANTSACQDIAGRCFSTKEFSDLTIRHYQEVKDRGFTNIIYPSLHKTGFCMADNLNAYVIGPSGLLFKCWEEISDDVEKSIGTVFEQEPRPFQIMNLVKYLQWDSFNSAECRDCSIFPLCLGGCLYDSLNSPLEKPCSIWKYRLQDILKLKHEIHQNHDKKGG